MYRGMPTLSEEILGWRTGHRHVAGVDEAGRGPMAGPVVAAAALLDPQFARQWWSELRDSKRISARQRSRLSRLLREDAAVGVGHASHDEIDNLGLLEATRQAMLRAVEALPCRPDLLLIDAVALPDRAGTAGGGPGWSQRSLIRGDALCASIAAASIVAKVERDGLMDEFDTTYPEYGFAQNRGYCTPAHLRALADHGPSPIHRRSFAPVRDHLAGLISPLPPC